MQLHETDLSHLEPGDGETIMTDSGKRIDLLRTLDGVEIYIDGELLDLPELAAVAAEADLAEYKVLHKEYHEEVFDEAHEEYHEEHKVIIIQKKREDSLTPTAGRRSPQARSRRGNRGCR